MPVLEGDTLPNTRAATPVGGLEAFLATIRKLETGTYDGRYEARGQKVRGSTPLGAYGILDENWQAWANRAGLQGSDWRDPSAQDRVAATRAQELFDAYGSWDMAAIAWIGGTESVRKIIQRGYDGPQSVQNQEIRDYLDGFQRDFGSAPDFGVAQRALPQKLPQTQIQQEARGGWVSPVAGPNEWSKGSWMPSSLTHRGRTHAATDIYAERGTPIISPVSGKVISTKKSKIGGFTARIQGDDGIIYYFAHMDEAAVVGAGQRVLAGNHIGFVGNSGSASSTSTHLHFSMKKANGQAINPTTFLGGAGSTEGFAATGMAFGQAPDQIMSAAGQMNGMLDQLSNSIAGGQRDPSIYAGEEVGPSIAVTEEVGTDDSSVPTTGQDKTTTEVA